LTEQELQALEKRVRAILLGAAVEVSSSGHYYFPVYNSSYAEAFGIIQGLNALGFGRMRDARGQDEHDFNLRRWFDALIERIISEKVK